jgi:uncharacterized protein (TIGR02996 family)
MPTYPTNPALEAAVIANAEDDTPRLAYADWLDENGDPDRAAFIRTQVALWDKNPADEDYVGLVEAKSEFETLHIPARLEQPVPEEVRFSHSGSRLDDESQGFHRGFPFFAREPSTVDGPLTREHASAFKRVFRRLFQTTTIRGLRFSGWFSSHLDLLLSSPESRKLSALCIEGGASDSRPSVRAVRTVIDSPAAPKLKWLGVNYVNTTDAKILASLPTVGALRRYQGSFQQCEPKPLQQLLTSDGFRGLHRIRVALSDANAAVGVRALAQLPELHTLESYSFGPREVAALGAGKFRALGKLSLHSAPLNGAGAVALAKAKMPALRVLELAGCGMGDEEINTLARSPRFENLHSLLLADPISDDAITAIAESGSAAHLRALEIQGSSVGSRGLQLLASKFPKLSQLWVLAPTRSFTSAAAARFLSKLACPALRSLILPFPMSDEAAHALANNPTLTRLSTLNITGRTQAEEMTSKGLEAIIHSPYLTNLTCITLVGTGLEKAASQLSDPAVLPRLRELRIGLSWKVGDKIAENRPGLMIR